MKGGDDIALSGCVPARLCQSASTGCSRARVVTDWMFCSCFIFSFSVFNGNSLEVHLLHPLYCSSTHSLGRYFANLAVFWDTLFSSSSVCGLQL